MSDENTRKAARNAKQKADHASQREESAKLRDRVSALDPRNAQVTSTAPSINDPDGLGRPVISVPPPITRTSASNVSPRKQNTQQQQEQPEFENEKLARLKAELQALINIEKGRGNVQGGRKLTTREQATKRRLELEIAELQEEIEEKKQDAATFGTRFRRNAILGAVGVGAIAGFFAYGAPIAGVASVPVLSAIGIGAAAISATGVGLIAVASVLALAALTYGAIKLYQNRQQIKQAFVNFGKSIVNGFKAFGSSIKKNKVLIGIGVGSLAAGAGAGAIAFFGFGFSLPALAIFGAGAAGILSATGVGLIAVAGAVVLGLATYGVYKLVTKLMDYFEKKAEKTRRQSALEEAKQAEKEAATEALEQEIGAATPLKHGREALDAVRKFTDSLVPLNIHETARNNEFREKVEDLKNAKAELEKVSEKLQLTIDDPKTDPEKIAITEKLKDEVDLAIGDMNKAIGDGERKLSSLSALEEAKQAEKQTTSPAQSSSASPVSSSADAAAPSSATTPDLFQTTPQPTPVVPTSAMSAPVPMAAQAPAPAPVSASVLPTSATTPTAIPAASNSTQSSTSQVADRSGAVMSNISQTVDRRLTELDATKAPIKTALVSWAKDHIKMQEALKTMQDLTQNSASFSGPSPSPGHP